MPPGLFIQVPFILDLQKGLGKTFAIYFLYAPLLGI